MFGFFSRAIGTPFSNINKKLESWCPLIVEIDEKVLDPLRKKTNEFGSFMGIRECVVFVKRMEIILSENPDEDTLKQICEDLRKENGRWADGLDQIQMILDARIAKRAA